MWQWCEDLQAVAAPSALPASPALPLPSHLVASTPTSIAAPVPQAQPVAPASVAAQTAVAPAATMAAPGQAAPNAPTLQAPAAVGQAIGAAVVSAPAATTPATPARAAPAAVTETTAEHGATVGLESEQAKSSMAMLNALKVIADSGLKGGQAVQALMIIQAALGQTANSTPAELAPAVASVAPVQVAAQAAVVAHEQPPAVDAEGLPLICNSSTHPREWATFRRFCEKNEHCKEVVAAWQCGAQLGSRETTMHGSFVRGVISAFEAWT